jgi:hypothetical protein
MNKYIPRTGVLCRPGPASESEPDQGWIPRHLFEYIGPDLCFSSHRLALICQYIDTMTCRGDIGPEDLVACFIYDRTKSKTNSPELAAGLTESHEQGETLGETCRRCVQEELGCDVTGRPIHSVEKAGQYRIVQYSPTQLVSRTKQASSTHQPKTGAKGICIVVGPTEYWENVDIRAEFIDEQDVMEIALVPVSCFINIHQSLQQSIRKSLQQNTHKATHNTHKPTPKHKTMSATKFDAFNARRMSTQITI